MIAIHCFLGTDQRIEIEDSAITEGQFQFDAVLQNTPEIANAQDFAEAINRAQIGLQMKILQARAPLGRQREEQIRP